MLPDFKDLPLAKIRSIKIKGKREMLLEDDFYYYYSLHQERIDKLYDVWQRSQLGNIAVCLKRVDEETKVRLYHKHYAPVVLQVYEIPVGSTYMYARIRSIDDSSYTITFPMVSKKNDFDIYKAIRRMLMAWLDDQTYLNGEEFLKKCIDLGAMRKSISYD